MKVNSQNINLDINLNRVSANSRSFSQKSDINSVAKDNMSVNTRENPFYLNNENFVIVDGKKLNLNARRGTYVNLIV